MYKITVGAWRNHTAKDPMQVVSGAMGREKIHFVAPDANRLKKRCNDSSIGSTKTGRWIRF